MQEKHVKRGQKRTDHQGYQRFFRPSFPITDAINYKSCQGSQWNQAPIPELVKRSFILHQPQTTQKQHNDKSCHFQDFKNQILHHINHLIIPLSTSVHFIGLFHKYYNKSERPKALCTLFYHCKSFPKTTV